MSAKGAPSSARDCLIDVSRLIWRAWRGRPATGIDRVCLAYLERFGPRALAVVQRKGLIVVLSARQSDRLFAVLARGFDGQRIKFLATIVGAARTLRLTPPRAGMVYFNVGHTGLDDPSLPSWISRNHIRAVYLIHDLIPLSHPQYCRAGEAERHARRMTHALQSAAAIIGNSQETVKELRKFARSRELPLPPVLSAPICGYDGCNNLRPKQVERPYFVTVGTIEARKNHLLLLRAWERIAEYMGSDTPRLVVIGNRGWEAEQAIRWLDRLGSLAAHVVEIDSCNDDDLATWIAGARALLMPSFVEGFGLPVVEALRLGTPVIASDLPVYREIAGEIPTYLDPADADAWARTCEAFTGEDPERKRQIDAIRSYCPPTWEGHFATVEPWVSEIVAGAGLLGSDPIGT